MATLSKSMVRYCLNLLFFILFIVPTAQAQTEAQAAEEILVLKHKENDKTFEIKKGERIIIPEQDGGRPGIKGNVVSFTETGFVLYDRRKKQSHNIDLNQTATLSTGNGKGKRAGGILLLIWGVWSLVGSLGILILAAILSGFFAAIIALIVLSFLFSLGLMALGIWLITKSASRIVLKYWTWKLVRKRRVIIKKKRR